MSIEPCWAYISRDRRYNYNSRTAVQFMWGSPQLFEDLSIRLIVEYSPFSPCLQHMQMLNYGYYACASSNTSLSSSLNPISPMYCKTSQQNNKNKLVLHSNTTPVLLQSNQLHTTLHVCCKHEMALNMTT